MKSCPSTTRQPLNFIAVLVILSFIVLLVGGITVSASSPASLPAAPNGPQAVYLTPTYSSPITVSNDKAWVWSVNPDDGSVSVINTGSDTEVFRIPVGHEPQSIAVDPNNQFVYVANAADNTVTVIRITNTAPFAAVVEETLTTGAEPWNIVISPDGKRVFVANSSQDTLTILKADVLFPVLPSILGNVNIGNSACNDPDRNRHFQPRGMAITLDNTRLYVTRFLSFVKPSGTQGSNNGKEALLCRLDINTAGATTATSVTNFVPILISGSDSGFPTTGSEFAYPNQLQSVVLRGDKAYLPNIASAPAGLLKFNADTDAYVNVVNGIAGPTQAFLQALNLHLGAQTPETGKTRLFFANPWAIAFTNQSGAGNAYAVSAGSDLLVKLDVDASGILAFTNGATSTRYIDLNDSANPITSGRNAGKNPLGIAIRDTGVPSQLKAYVMNYISRNISVVDLSTDAVTGVINLTNLPLPGTVEEQMQVGKEIFFSSRGNFDRPVGTTVSTQNRLSSEGWQSCSSCHFAGLTDGNIWSFASGPRKSVPLNGTFSPHDPNDQRILNYSAIFDEVQDFERNIRDVSGPGPIINFPTQSLDPNHGLLIGDTGNINAAPGTVDAFNPANSSRPQISLTLPASTTAWPALDALESWVRSGIRTPNGALTTTELTAGGGDPTGGINAADAELGRLIFMESGCGSCHGGSKWTRSRKDFAIPPPSAEIAVENPTALNAVTTSYLPRFLMDVGSYNLGVLGKGNDVGSNIGAIEKSNDQKDALGFDYNGDNKGKGYNIPSLLGIGSMPPYFHNGACESLDCVLSNVAHRTRGLPFGQSDLLASAISRAQLTAFLQTLDADTVFPVNLKIVLHDVFLDPPVIYTNAQETIGVNVQLYGSMKDLNPANPIFVRFIAPGLDIAVPLPPFTQDFGQVTVTVPWTVPSLNNFASIIVSVDSAQGLIETDENDNAVLYNTLVKPPPPDTTPPVVTLTKISDDTPFYDDDPITAILNPQVKITASDAGGLGSYCIVNYYYDSVLRRFVESTCTFKPLPAPISTVGDASTYIVRTAFQDKDGVAYAFVWIKDLAGNISRAPGFDVISYITSAPIKIVRNDVLLYRISLLPHQGITLNFPIIFGDVDVAVFDGVAVNSLRIAVSAHNGTAQEAVAFINNTGATRVFQLEVKAIVNSLFSIQTAGPLAAQLGAASAGALTGPAAVGDPSKPFIAGPPALQTAVNEAQQVFLPALFR